ncbi:hypothetical protein G9A89_013271 [Geosiphon pyriformis]|nr:hypothetical protein G9A89_013271 [Geosiphon pyriformis]
MESKLKGKICLWIANKFDGVWVFTSDLESGYLGAGIVVIMDSSLARHISVSILGLYTGASLTVWFSQADKINSLFGDFNKDGSHKCISFKKCVDLELVNSLANSRDIMKTIDFMFVFLNLVNAIVHKEVLGISEYFDMDHKAVSMSKFNFKNADENKWNNFKDVMLANVAMFSNEFTTASRFSDLDIIWNVIHKSSRFYRLELLVSKIVRAFHGNDIDSFVSFMGCWYFLNNTKTLVICNLVDSGVTFNCVCFVLFGTRKSYCALKLVESLRAKEANIRSAIDKRMESFEINKSYSIKNVLECLFCKVVLDHLVVNDKLVLKPGLVKSRYQPLGYVFNRAFSGVICSIKFDEFFGVVSNLPDDKAKEAWVSMISKPYKWKSVLTNICPIALIETAYKILFKILSNRISPACSTFNVLHGDNFLVLKSTTTQSPIFAIGLVIEDALEKNWELWLVL